MGYRIHVINREDAAKAAIANAHGSVRYGKPWFPQYGDAYATDEPKMQRSRIARIFLGNGTGGDVCTVWLRGYEDGTRLDDAGFRPLLRHLLAFRDLRELCLDEQGITNETLFRLAGIETLEVLKIPLASGVDDGAVDAIASMRRLRFLDVFKTSITVAGARRIQAALPHCRIRGPERSVGWLSHDRYFD